MNGLCPGLWILGDSAFAVREGKVHRIRKRGELLPSDPVRARWQLDLEMYCSKMRIASEWGVKDLKNTWRIFLNMRLASDDGEKRKKLWLCILFLHNFRIRTMNIGQMHTVFIRDVEYNQ